MDTIIFIPGHGCTARVFAAQMELLSAQYHCVCIDLREYKTIEEVILDILKKAPKQFFILGFSLGAAIALHVSQQAPERIKGHIHISLPYEGPPQVLVEDLVHVETMLSTMDMTTFAQQAYQKYFPHRRTDDPLYAVLLQMLNDTEKVHYLEQAHMLLRPWNLLPKAHAQHPVLILGGALDKRAKPEYHQHMAKQLKTATLHLFPNTGHFLTLEQPTLASQKIKEWLAQCNLTSE